MKENDIIKLDFILNKIIKENQIVTAEILITGGFYTRNEVDLAISDFTFYQNIFKKLKVGEIKIEEDNDVNMNSAICLQYFSHQFRSKFRNKI